MTDMMDPFAEEFGDKLSRTIQILNVPKHLVDLIELHVEHTKHGGGEFEDINYDDSHQNMTVTFVDAKGLTKYCMSFFFNVFGDF